MNRRINSRVVDTAGVALNILIERDASEIYWIVVSPQALTTQGIIQIHDGFDPGGRLVYQVEPGQAMPQNFIPSIPCEQGIFVVTDANIASYTIAWRPKKWDRPTTQPEDVIKSPTPEE